MSNIIAMDITTAALSRLYTTVLFNRNNGWENKICMNDPGRFFKVYIMYILILTRFPLSSTLQDV